MVKSQYLGMRWRLHQGQFWIKMYWGIFPTSNRSRIE
jgi:hypothetical protein